MDKVKYRKKSNKIKGKSVLERLLKESEEKYRLITENALVGIYQLDAAGRFIFVNKALARLVGYQPKELIGKHFSFVLPPARTLKGQEIFKELTANGQYKKKRAPIPRIKESYLRHKKGHDLYVQYSFNLPFKTKGNGYLSKIALTGTVTDISEHKKTEEELMIRTKTLETLKTAIEHEKVQVEAILNSIGDGVIATDTYGRIMMVNKTAERLLDQTAPELFGKSVTETLSLFDGETGVPLLKEQRPLDIALTTGRTISTHAAEGYRIYIGKNGRKFPVSITAAPVRLNKIIIGGIETFRDISKSQEIDKAKSEFVSLASHQLRTPLTIIGLYSEMLKSESGSKNLTTEQKKYLNEIVNANKRMIKLVDLILNVSRIDLGVLNVVSMPIDFVEIAETIWKEFLPQIKNKELKFEKNYDANLPILKSDPKLLEVILENLVSNAVKYTPPQGQIELSIKPKGQTMIIKVSDTGYGIPASQQNKVFSKMFRAENVLNKDADGTGLGLYMVKSIVEKMGGKIWFESEENKGTSFFVILPQIHSMRKITYQKTHLRYE